MLNSDLHKRLLRTEQTFKCQYACAEHTSQVSWCLHYVITLNPCVTRIHIVLCATVLYFFKQSRLGSPGSTTCYHFHVHYAMPCLWKLTWNVCCTVNSVIKIILIPGSNWGWFSDPGSLYCTCYIVFVNDILYNQFLYWVPPRIRLFSWQT